MGSETALTVFVAITALAFLAQAVGVLLIYRKISEANERVNQLSGEVRERVRLVTDQVAEVTRAFQPIGEQLQTLSANLTAISQTARTRAEDLDYFLGQTTESLRGQVGHINDFLTRATLRMEDTANLVQRGLLTPIQEVTAMVKGLRVGLGFLFTRWPVSPARRRPTPDDEMFI